MLTPELLALHNAAVARLPLERAEEERKLLAISAAHYAKVANGMNHLVNALERGESLAAAEALDAYELRHCEATQELYRAAMDAVYPMKIVSTGQETLSEIFAKADPVGHMVENDAATAAEVKRTVGLDLSQVPLETAKVGAVLAEPIVLAKPAAVTPPEANRKSKGRR